MNLPRIAAMVIALFLTACSSKHPDALVPVVETAAGAHPVDVMVATSRVFDKNKQQFTDGRAAHLTFEHLIVSIPPEHEPGKIEWPKTYPGNPARDFVAIKNEVLDESRFMRDINARIGPTGEIWIFVHGFNTTHEDAIFRLAQMKHDSGAKQAAIAFTWPSRGSVTEYLTDRESATASRNRFEELLTMLAASPRIKRIHILAHSMGTMLANEVIMFSKLRANKEFHNKLDVVILADPDIDVDVFLAELEYIGRREKPTVILTSRDDQALRISRFLAGDIARVGAANIYTPESQRIIKKYGLTVVDMTDLKSSDPINHTKFAHSGEFLKQMTTAVGGDLSRGEHHPGDFIVNTTGFILATPGKVFRQVTNGVGGAGGTATSAEQLSVR